MKEVVIFILVTLLLINSGVAQENNPPVANAGEDLTTNPNKIVVIDASASFDLDNNIDDNSFSWYENEQLIGKGIIFQTKFQKSGKKIITLKLTDHQGLSDIDNIRILIKEKESCINTNATYYPDDTKCNDAWPSKDGKVIFINSKEYSCNLVEICSEELDPMIEDSIACCTGREMDLNKQGACSFAKDFSKGNLKSCQGLFVIKALGTQSIYMQGYLEAEMCCSGIGELCKDPNKHYTARPLPQSNTFANYKDLSCLNTPANNPPGYWNSDTNLKENNLALTDVPAHVSINVLSTGTCVDYSFAVTTLLRKIGYKKDEVYSVETPTHAFNLVKLHHDKKYSIVDTTGTLADINLGGKPSIYNYCEEMTKCFNDLGRQTCPNFNEITACEGIDQSLLQKIENIQFKITNQISNLVDAIIEET